MRKILELLTSRKRLKDEAAQQAQPLNPLKGEFTLILASASPRRKQLLEAMGFSPLLRPTHIDENYPPQMPVEKVASWLARKKAKAAGKEGLAAGQIILAADSTVILEGQLFEKPKDEQDAKNILRKLSGNTHEVITGVCLLSDKREEVFSESTRVRFAPMEDWEIEKYIATKAPFDKAGAYGIQDWIGLCKVENIEGSYTNVMGLPSARTYEMLKKMLSQTRVLPTFER